jgi:teichuronic acid biosynthesis glycosyltransferase TuaC
MKVLHVVGGYPTTDNPQDGIFIKSQIDSLNSTEVIIDVFLLKGRYIKKYFLGVFRLRKYLRKNKFDLIHAHYMYSGWTARLSTMLPLVVSFMGTDVYGEIDKTGRESKISFFIHRNLSRLLGKLCSRVIVKSEKLNQILKLKNSKIIPNGIDLSFFRKIEVNKNELNLNNNIKYIIFAGNPARNEKRYDLALSAFRLLKMKYEKVDLLNIVNKPQEKILKYYNAVDCLLLTSRHEGSPNVIKEALACNLPVVSVDVGDVRERLNGADNCYIVEDNLLSIADALLKVLVSDRRSSNGKNSVEKISINKIAEAVIDLYKEVLLK